MAVGDVGQDLESIEREAERVLDEARVRAREILEQAGKECDKILASELAVDEISAECRKIVEQAEGEAKGIGEKAANEAELIRARAEARVPDVVQRIARTIRGD